MTPYLKETQFIQAKVTHYGTIGQYLNSASFPRNVGRHRLSNVSSTKGSDRVTPHAQDYLVEDITDTYGTYTIKEGSGYARAVYYDVMSPSTRQIVPVYNGDSVLLGRVTGDLLSKVRSSDLNLAVSVAEGKQTTSMITKALKSTFRWRREAISLLKDIGKPLSKGSKRAADKWLESVYGWRPLMQDVHNLAVYSRNFLKERPIRAYGTSSKRTVEENGGSSYWHQSVSGYTQYRLLMSRRLRINDTNAVDLNRLTSLDPLVIVWELIPYSFVVDWFFDVGGYLENLEAAVGRGYTVVSGFDTYTATTRLLSVVSRGPGAGDSYPVYSGTGAYRATIKKRVVAGSLPTPQPPSFKVDLGASRILSSAALVRQSIRF